MNSEPVPDSLPIKNRRSRFLDASLLVLIVFGLAARFFNLKWDETRLLHPDERFLASVVARVKLPTSWTGYFESATSPLNPANIPDVHYVYGQLPVTLARILWEGVGGFCRLFEIKYQILDDSDFLVYGRALSGIFDCLTIFVAFALGKRLLGRTGGLATAAFVSLAALHIQQSHFFVVDTFAAAFLAFALQGMIIWSCTGKWWWALESGIAFGCALACKFSALLFVPAALAATVIVCKRSGVKPALGGLGVFILCGLCLFRLGHPMAFMGTGGWLAPFDFRLEPRFWTDMQTQQVITQGEMDVPFNIQWIGRKPWLYTLGNLWKWGWGYAFLLSIALGLGALAYGIRAKKRAGAELWLVLFYGLIIFLVQGATFSKFTRYSLPITIAGAVVAAYGLTWLSAERPRWSWLQVAAPAGAGVWTLAVMAIYAQRHPRLEATDWARGHIPANSIILNETAWDEGVPLSWIPWPDGSSRQDPYYRLDLQAFETDTEVKGLNFLAKLDAGEWLILSSNRVWGTTPRWPERYPIMKRFYQTLFDGTLGFELDKDFHSYPRLGPWTFPDGDVEEALTVYDHPRVLIYRKSSSWSAEKARKLLLDTSVPDGQSRWRPRLAAPVNEADLPRPRG